MSATQQAHDPAQILHELPEREHDFFLQQYREAAHTAAEDPAAYQQLQEFLRAWSIRAVAVNEPGYYQRRAEAKNPPPGTTIPTEQVIPGWQALTESL